MNKFKKILLVLFFIIISLSASAADDELTFWNFWDPKLIVPVIEAFEKENPGVKIHNEQLTWNNGLDKIVVAMANNRAPDICEMGSTWMGKFMAEGALLDVTDEFSPLKDKYIMWEPAQMNGRLYGMPWLAGTRVMFYNKDLFIKAGLDPEKPPVTWDEFLEACKKIHDPKNGVFGFGMNAGEGHILYKKFLPFGWGNGARVLDENGNFVFDSKEMREALEFYLKLKEYSFCEKQDLLNDAFKKGKLGFEISGSWIFARLPIEAPNLNFGTCLVPKPSYEKGFSTSFMGGEILVLFKSCKNKELATKFIKYLTRSENALLITKEAWTSFPANVRAFSDPAFSDPKTQVFFEQMKTGIHPPVHRFWIELETIINTTVEKAMYGEPIDKVMKEARAEYERIVKSKSKTEPISNKNEINMKETAKAAQLIQTTQSNQPNQTNWLMILVSFIAVGTLINAVLMSFILYELKKKD
jgi:multiple sugar transport system substrate-binding protein